MKKVFPFQLVRGRHAPLCLLLACSAILYFRSLSGGFVFDDRVYFLDNDILPRLGLLDLRTIFLYPTNYFGELLPVRDFLYVLQYRAFGTEPAGYHAVSIVLYALTVVVVYGVCLAVFTIAGADGRSQQDGPVSTSFSALLVSAFFAVHPAHVESVANIAGQKDILFALFSLLAVYVLLRGSDRPDGLSRRHSALLVACYYLAFLSKRTAVADALFIPIVWFLFARKGEGIKKPLVFWVIVTIPAALWILYTIDVSSAIDGGRLELMSPAGAVKAVRIIGAHMQVAFSPFLRNFGYPFVESALFDRNFWIGLLAVSLGAVAVWRRRRLEIWASALIFCYLLPVLQIFGPLGNESVYDRYLFVPVLGLGILFERLFTALAGYGRMVKAAYGVAIVVLTSLAAATYAYIPNFHDDVTASANACRKFPEWRSAPFHYAYALIEAGRLDDALAFARSEKTFDQPPWVRDYFIGWILLEKGQGDEATRILELASASASSGGYFPFPNVPLGRALIHAGRFDDARAVLQYVISTKSNQPLELYRARRLMEMIPAAAHDR